MLYLASTALQSSSVDAARLDLDATSGSFRRREPFLPWFDTESILKRLHLKPGLPMKYLFFQYFEAPGLFPLLINLDDLFLTKILATDPFGGLFQRDATTGLDDFQGLDPNIPPSLGYRFAHHIFMRGGQVEHKVDDKG
jgi:hypothetical protein